MISLPLLAAADNPAQIDRMTQQWLDTERQASRLQADWKTQKPVLKQRLDILKTERLELNRLLKQRRVNHDNVDNRRAALLAEQSELEQQQIQLARAQQLLTSRLDSITPLLPPSLVTAWRHEQATLSDGGELQVALAKLSRLADFNQRVTLHESTVGTNDGQYILVQQLYLGVSVAWFVSRDGQHAGWGQADENGWRWHFDNSVNASAVSDAIAMFEKRQVAELVRLPMRLSAQQIAKDSEQTQNLSAQETQL